MQWQIPTAFGESALGGISESIELLNARAAERHVVHAYAKVAESKSTRVGQMQAHKYICQSGRVPERQTGTYAKVPEWDNWHICRCLWRMQQEAADQRAKYTHSNI